MTRDIFAIWNELDWRCSKLQTKPFQNGYLCRGLLSVTPRSKTQPKYIAYGAFDRDKDKAAEKAVSEMVERMAWYACLHALAARQISVAAFSTVGWAAHTSLEAAKLSSRGEYLERHFFEVLVRRLSQSQTPDSVCPCFRLMSRLEFDGIPSEGIIFGLEMSIKVPYEDIHLAYVFLCCALNDQDRAQSGVTFGMGHSDNENRARTNARIEAFLVTNAVKKLINNAAHDDQKKSLSKGEAEYFKNLYLDQRVLRRVTQLASTSRSSKKEHCGFCSWKPPELSVTLDLTVLLPDFLRRIDRHVCYTCPKNSNQALILGDFNVENRNLPH